jgi:phenylacetate-CoA ligase
MTALRLPPPNDARPVRTDDRSALDLVLDRARRAPFYAATLAGSRADAWESIPLVTKSDLRNAYPFGMLAVSRTELATYHESTGTSGQPTSSYFTEGDWDDVAARFLRNAVNLGRADTVLVKTPYAMVTTAHQTHRAARLAGALVVPADNRSSNMSYPRVLRLLRDIPVTVAWCMPTEALLWAAAARLAGFDTRHEFAALRAFVVAGEPMSHEKRARIGELWNARVFEDFGSTETGSLAGECPAGHLHLWADRFLVEVLDPATGRTRAEGDGELVLTTLAREAMPLVRYRMGDSVRVSYQPCSCGWSLPTIRVSGRVGAAVTAAGREVHAVDVEAAVFSLPIEHGVLFYRARATDRGLEVEIEARPSVARQACDALAALLATRLGVLAEVRSVAEGALVSSTLLVAETAFRKPTYLFGPGDEWSSAVTY